MVVLRALRVALCGCAAFDEENNARAHERRVGRFTKVRWSRVSWQARDYDSIMQ